MDSVLVLKRSVHKLLFSERYHKNNSAELFCLSLIGSVSTRDYSTLLLQT